MRTGFVFLTLAYVLSQFYRAILAVMTQVLGADLGATAADLSMASGLWFGAFAAMQIPVGWALDRIGPRWTAAVLLAIGGGGGSAFFAMAQSPSDVQMAMVLLGIGCSPVLMASYYIFARLYRPAMFATLAGVVLGVGTAGNLAGSVPLALAIETLGWRTSLWAMVVASLLVSAGLAVFVKDMPKIAAQDGLKKGNLLDILKIPALWVIFPLLIVNYAPAAGIRGLWAGPYMCDVFGLDAGGIGTVTLWMAVAMMAGSFLYGPLDRMLGTRKWVIVGGNLLGAACLLGLWAFAENAVITSTILLFGIGLFGLSFPLMMAHGRSFIPPHLLGRGVTLLNLCSIGGVGLLQWITGRMYVASSATAQTAAAPYQSLFLFFAVLIIIGCAIYSFSEDRMD
ncbi:MAG: MFS transporter [Paracoccaceae bacterium]|jgi:MFS family permease